ncbi:hypothetical protein M404DRAFT_135663, partial [Pisolithus tinctorius Marx 270]
SEQDPLPYSRPEEQYHISPSTKYLLHISSWLGQNADDLATRKFLPKLKDHILARIFGKEYDSDEEAFTRDQRNALHFVNVRIYRHKSIRINYTSYDCHQAQDSLNPRTHADIMVLAHEDECLDQDGLAPHPYWYARIIGIFHTTVRYCGMDSMNTSPQHIDFLWVRWYARDA